MMNTGYDRGGPLSLLGVYLIPIVGIQENNGTPLRDSVSFPSSWILPLTATWLAWLAGHQVCSRDGLGRLYVKGCIVCVC